MYQSTLKRYTIGSLVAAMLLAGSIAPSSAHAQSASLQSQIQALLAQIATLQAQVSGMNTGTCPAFTANLTMGSSGTQVTALQNFLIGKGYQITAGATGYFGGQTQVALSAYQSANGISPAAGYFGPVTRAKVSAMCVATPAPSENTGGNTGGSNNNSGSNSGGVLRGEASLEKYQVNDGEYTDLSEGDKEARVMEVEFDVEDGDIKINRIDVAFDPASLNNEQDPWDTFKEVSLYAGGTRIGRVIADDKDKWEKDAPASGDYRIRFSGLNWVLEEGNKAELHVAVTVLSSVKGAADGETWEIFIPDNGIRGLDADRASQYIGNTADTVSFEIDEEGSDDELTVRSSDENPDSTTLKLESNKRSSWHTVFAFDLDTDDSKNDIELRELPIDLTFSSSTYTTLVHDARLRIGNKTFTDFSFASNTLTFNFDRGELSIDAGDRETVELQLTFKQLASGNEGVTIEASVDASGIDAEGADDLAGGQLSGSATSETHTLRTSGAILVVKSSTETGVQNSHDITSDNEGSYTIKFDVTAFNSDLYVPRSAVRGETMGTAGANYSILDASVGGLATTTGSSLASLSSSATIDGGYYKVREGETRTFTLTVEFNPDMQSFYQVRLHSLNFATGSVDPTTQQIALPASRFETSPLSINN